MSTERGYVKGMTSFFYGMKYKIFDFAKIFEVVTDEIIEKAEQLAKEKNHEVSVYEIMKPESIGLNKNNFVLGKSSGKHAFEEKLKEMGYELSEEDVESVFNPSFGNMRIRS